MLDALPPSDLRNLRDRAILLLGFAGGLRRSEIVGLVMSPEDSLEGSGWPEFFDDGVLLTLRGKTGWREVEIGRGSTRAHLPGRRARGLAEIRAHRARAAVPGGRRARGRIRTDSTNATSRAWSSAWRSPQACAATSPSASERRNSPGHSLRAGLASSAEIDERYVQKHLGHASAEMTRRYQRRRDRFRVNLTKAAGL